MAQKVGAETVRYTSREGKEFSVLGHLTPYILPLLEVKEILDGELFTRALTFQQICSAVKREKTVNPHTVLLEFWIYDIIQKEPFVKRSQYLRELLPKKGPLIAVLTRRLRCAANVDKFHDEMVEFGGELVGGIRARPVTAQGRQIADLPQTDVIPNAEPEGREATDGFPD